MPSGTGCIFSFVLSEVPFVGINTFLITSGKKYACSLIVKIPASHTWVPECESQLWLLTPACCHYRPWGAAAMTQIFGFMLPMGNLWIPLSDPHISPNYGGHLLSEEANRSQSYFSLSQSFLLPSLPFFSLLHTLIIKKGSVININNICDLGLASLYNIYSLVKGRSDNKPVYPMFHGKQDTFLVIRFGVAREGKGLRDKRAFKRSPNHLSLPP